MSSILLATDNVALASELQAAKPGWTFLVASDLPSAEAIIDAGTAEVAVFDRRSSWVADSLMRHARSTTPETVCIALVQDLDVSEAVRNARLAHQVISASSPSKVIAGLCERALSVNRIVNDARVVKTVAAAPDLAAPPELWVELSRVLEDPDSGAKSVAAVVASDAVIAANVMRLANSAFFGLSKHVSQLQMAVSLLGFTTIRALVLESTANRSMASQMADFRRNEVQKHSMSTARVARQIAGAAHLSDAFLAGLLMDVGLVLMSSVMPDEMRTAIKDAENTHTPLYQVEEATFGFTHASVSACLLGMWGLPYNVLDAVAHHHERPDLSGALSVREALYLARDATQFYGSQDPYDRPGPLLREDELEMSVSILVESARSVASDMDTGDL